MTARVHPAGVFLFHAYCGMSDGETYSRDEAAALLRARRSSGHPVTVLEAGRVFEIEEPEGAAMVPDTAGLLTFRAARPCLACGEDTNGRSGAFEAREADGWLCGRECARTLAEREAEEQARFDAETAEDDGQGDDSEDETSVLWRPSSATMAAARKLFPGAF